MCFRTILIADVVKEHIDAAKVIGGYVDLLAVVAVDNAVLSKHLFRLQQQRAGATSRVNLNAVINTKVSVNLRAR